MKILWKRGEIAPKEQFLLFSTKYCCLSVDLCVKTGTRISLRDKRLFEISEFEITRVDCIYTRYYFYNGGVGGGGEGNFLYMACKDVRAEWPPFSALPGTFYMIGPLFLTKSI